MVILLIFHVLFTFHFACCCVSCSFVIVYHIQSFPAECDSKSCREVIHNNILLPFLGDRLAVSLKLFAAPDSHVMWVNVSIVVIWWIFGLDDQHF